MKTDMGVLPLPIICRLLVPKAVFYLVLIYAASVHDTTQSLDNQAIDCEDHNDPPEARR